MTRAEAIESLAQTLGELHDLVEQERVLYGRLVQAAQHVMGAADIEVHAIARLADDEPTDVIKNMLAFVHKLERP